MPTPSDMWTVFLVFALAYVLLYAAIDRGNE
jgi:hypothetical protein